MKLEQLFGNGDIGSDVQDVKEDPGQILQESKDTLVHFEVSNFLERTQKLLILRLDLVSQTSFKMYDIYYRETRRRSVSFRKPAICSCL